MKGAGIMKTIKRIIACALISMLVVSIGLLCVFADQENNMDVPHEHEYQITAFDKGEITFTCEVCGEAYTECFSNYLNDNNETLDMNNDGIVNGKDYAYLNQQY